MSKSPTHVPDFGLQPNAFLSGVEIKVAGKDLNKSLVYVYAEHEEKFLVGKKAVMCITGRVLGNHTKSLVGNKNHSFEYNGKTICVEKGKEAYSITLTDVNIKSLMSSLWKPMPNIEAASNVLVTCKYGKTRT